MIQVREDINLAMPGGKESMSTKQSVQVRESHLRNSPSFLGKIVATVQYGDRLTILEDRDSWLKVSGHGTPGWLHSSAMTTKEIILKPNAGDVARGADSDEIALAGKGFNQQVEQKYRKKHSRANFAWIDRMEKIVISQNEMQSFIKQGDLKVERGDA